MRRILPTVVDTKYAAILSQERRLAKAVARRIVKIPDITVWAFMVPFIFLFIFLRYKRANETFVLNFLFTKKLALEATLDIVKKGEHRQDMIAQIEQKTSGILADEKKGIYSEKIRRKQVNEINLLLDHYLKLLEAEGNSYESLVRNAYQTQDKYQTFLNELTLAEKAVNRTALQTVGRTETAHEIIAGMEKATEELRAEQAEKIFT